MKNSLRILISTIFLFNHYTCLQAQELLLPKPGERVHLSSVYDPSVLKGIKVYPDNPFKFDFVLDVGASPRACPTCPGQPHLPAGRQGAVAPTDIKSESQKLIKYFLASLTIPEKDLWVNLSPYEKNRIIPDAFGQTEMGRDLLAQDYMLKQITASLIYPEDEIGKKFWKRVYEEAAKKFGTTNIPIDTFNKVWIVPDKAVVYENVKAGTAYVVESRLKVMLEEDYLALDRNDCRGESCIRPINGQTQGLPLRNTNAIGSNIIREIVIPALTKEINEGKNFAPLRQVYNSLILATWYKKKIKDSILNQVYTDKNKIKGIEYVSLDFPPPNLPHKGGGNDVELIYQHYLQAFKKGAYNLIKEEQDPVSKQMIPRKYLSGGIGFARHIGQEILTTRFINPAQLSNTHLFNVSADLAMFSDHAMIMNTGEVMDFDYDDALVGSLSGLMIGARDKANEEIAMIIRMNHIRKKVLLAVTPYSYADDKGGHGALIKRAHEINRFSHQTIAREWISLILRRDDQGRVLNFSLAEPMMRHPKMSYSDKMIEFLGKKKNEMADFFDDPEYMNEIHDELIRIGQLLSSAVQRAGLDVARIGLKLTSKAILNSRHAEVTLQALAGLKLRNNVAMVAGKAMTELDRLKIELNDKRKRLAQAFYALEQGRLRWQISLLEKRIADAKRSDKSSLGGIDFNANAMNLQVQNNQGAIKFHLDPALLQHVQHAPGFTPVIIHIKPMTDLRIFLGLSEETNTSGQFIKA